MLYTNACLNCFRVTTTYKEHKFCTRACQLVYVRRPDIILSRFNSLIDAMNNNGCRLWLGGTFLSGGYGQFSYVTDTEKINARAHVFSYAPFETLDLCVLHKCDIPLCVEKSHLFLGTRKDNSDDKIRKGRHHFRASYGEDQGSSKMTEAGVLHMRKSRLEGALLRELAEEYQISIAQVSHIVNREHWSWLPD